MNEKELEEEGKNRDRRELRWIIWGGGVRRDENVRRRRLSHRRAERML